MRGIIAIAALTACLPLWGANGAVLDWDGGLGLAEPLPIAFGRRSKPPRKNSGTVTALIRTFKIFGDKTIAFSAMTQGFREGEQINALVESGTVIESNGSFSDPKFKRFAEPFARVQADRTAHFFFTIANIQDGYLRISFPGQQAPGDPPSILTLGVNGNVTPCDPCRVLHGYGGAGRP